MLPAVLSLFACIDNNVSAHNKSAIDTAADGDSALIVDTSTSGDSAPDSGQDTVVVHECECPDDFSPTPDGDACVRQVSVAATYNGATIDVCKGTKNAVYGKFGALYPGGRNDKNNYWGDDDGDTDGRLNEVGIWACDGGSSTAGEAPVGEWIGFSACLDVVTAGDYIVGIAADNQVRLVVDGVEIFTDTSGTTRAFNYWFLQAAALTSGTHQVELFGKNDGSIASFGAEIAGPFPAGSLADDSTMAAADYEGSVVFTTADRIGGFFELGDSSGWSCPEGYALDECGAEPMCTETEYAACE